MDLQREPLLLGKARTVRSKILFKHGLTIILALGLPSLALAQSQDTDIRPNANQLSAEEIKSTFSDVTMDGAYNFGRNGKAQSFYTEKHKPDGTLTYTEDGKSDPGRWFVRQDTLCFMYPPRYALFYVSFKPSRRGVLSRLSGQKLLLFLFQLTPASRL